MPGETLTGGWHASCALTPNFHLQPGKPAVTFRPFFSPKLNRCAAFFEPLSTKQIMSRYIAPSPRRIRCWPSSAAPSGLPPAASDANYQKVLEPPVHDAVRESVAQGERHIAELATDFGPVPEIVQIIADEQKRWGALPFSGESLASKMARWDRKRQEEFVSASAAHEAHSFALEGVTISQEKTRAEIAARLLS